MNGVGYYLRALPREASTPLAAVLVLSDYQRPARPSLTRSEISPTFLLSQLCTGQNYPPKGIEPKYTDRRKFDTIATPDLCVFHESLYVIGIPYSTAC